MTNAQKWIAAFLGVFLLLFILSKVTKKEDSYYSDDEHYNEQSNEPVKEVDGITLITRVGCTKCHGQDLKGTKLAPSLYGVKKYWTTKDAFINYLKNPNSYSRDERFQDYQKQYKSMMPGFNNIDEKDLGKIADYVLTLED